MHKRIKEAASADIVRLRPPMAALAHGLANGRFRPGMIARLFAVEARSAVAVPLMISRAACGFPSPADDYMDRPLDFNELLIEQPAATFAVRVTDESMTGAGIFPNDIAVINRALHRYMKAGVMLLDLHPAASLQGGMFDPPDTPRSAALMRAIDDINRDFGRGTIYYAAAGRTQAWKLRSAFHSPRYTTSSTRPARAALCDGQAGLRS